MWPATLRSPSGSVGCSPPTLGWRSDAGEQRRASRALKASSPERTAELMARHSVLDVAAIARRVGTTQPPGKECRLDSRVLPTVPERDGCDDRRMIRSALVVDDDPDFLELATRILEGMGIEVATATDAAAAIAAANATEPEAMLVDIGLPDRDGIELAYELAALSWAPRVVLTSTDAEAAHAIELRDQSGRIPFVPKDKVANGSLRRLLSAE